MSSDDLLLRGLSVRDATRRLRNNGMYYSYLLCRIQGLTASHASFNIAPGIRVVRHDKIRKPNGKLLRCTPPIQNNESRVIDNAYAIRRTDFGGIHKGLIDPKISDFYIEIYFPSKSEDESYEAGNKTPETLRNLLLSIYVCTDSSWKTPGEVHFLAQPKGGLAGSVGRGYYPRHRREMAEPIDVEVMKPALIRKVFQSISQKESNASLQLAFRRYWISILRDNPSDAVLDSFIGLEALFSGSNLQNGDQLALRIAAALGKGDEAGKMYRTTKCLYKKRNDIVHGKLATTEDHRRHAMKATDLLKRGLLFAISAHCEGDALVDQLDDQILSGATRTCKP